ncbi:MAG TPA: hypothetical protein VLA64_07490, partial [Azonexus sp.]|nr:hypothetical protein [Azonexus sp.]
LNFLLMASFIALMMAGAASGGIMALEHRLSAVAGRRLRRAVTWLHVVALWPMPVLITFHVLV